MRAARLSSAIVAPTFVASALAGCAPVGAGLRAAGRDRLARVQGDQGLEGRHAAAAASRRATGGPCSAIRSSAGSERCGRRVEPDRQGRRGQLSRGPCADRRGARRPLPDRQRQRLGDAFVARHPARGVRHEPHRRGVGASGPSTCGGRCGGRSKSQAAGSRRRARPISPTRRSRQQVGARARLRHAVREADSLEDLLTEDGRRLQAFAHDRAEPVSTPARRPSPTSSPLRRRCSTPRPS